MRLKVFLVKIIISCLLQSLNSQDTLWVDSFENSGTKSLPDGWGQRYDGDNSTYNVILENGNKILNAHSKQSDNFIIKKFEVDLVEYPFLQWKWKANKLPTNGDERSKSTCDVVASINVVVRASKWRPKTVKYSWSTTLDKGTITASPFAIWPSRCDVLIVESGNQTDTWKEVKVNVLEDIMGLYDLDNLESFKIEAIVILTDSDNTNSEAEAYYDDIYFTKL